ncbi:ribosomal protein S18 [Delphinella strobiligena]|nr:ribosomal protein S18 [Delphinella strobiligena]
MEKSVQEIGAANRRKESLADIQRATDRQELERQLTRRWKSGDVYAPHDLSGVEMSKWRQLQPKAKPKKDVFDMLNINPLDHYKNFAMMSEYMTEMGRIKHNKDTGLRPVNQRKMAKAVRRAIGLGLMPSVHRHPEILDLERRRTG